jgi:hypothetical protein
MFKENYYPVGTSICCYCGLCQHVVNNKVNNSTVALLLSYLTPHSKFKDLCTSPTKHN